jgi:hypothetical protein
MTFAKCEVKGAYSVILLISLWSICLEAIMCSENLQKAQGTVQELVFHWPSEWFTEGEHLAVFTQGFLS